MTERDKQLNQEKVFEFVEPTIEQQIEVWAFTHLKPREAVVSFGRGYTHRELFEEVKSRSELGQNFLNSLEEANNRHEGYSSINHI